MVHKCIETYSRIGHKGLYIKNIIEEPLLGYSNG